MKIVGVSPAGVARLHDVLKHDIMRSDKEHHFENPNGDGTVVFTKTPYVEMMDSRLHPTSGTYTVTLRVNLVVETYVGNPAISQSMKTPLFIFPSGAGWKDWQEA